METPGRLSTTASTLAIGDCWSTIGSATTLVAKIRGSSATTVIDSINRSISSTTSSETVAPASTDTGTSRVSKPGSTRRTTWLPAETFSKAKRPSGPVTRGAPVGARAPVSDTATPGNAPPPESIAVPSMVPVDWPLAGDAGASDRTAPERRNRTSFVRRREMSIRLASLRHTMMNGA